MEQNPEKRTIFDALVVTSCEVYIIKDPKGKLLAYARVILNSQLQLTGLRVVEGKYGLFVGYPSDKSCEPQTIYFPVVRQLRDDIEEAVLQKYWDIKNSKPERTKK
jgi:stage V sporulation protein G